jgi:hypothetical protein
MIDLFENYQVGSQFQSHRIVGLLKPGDNIAGSGMSADELLLPTLTDEFPGVDFTENEGVHLGNLPLIAAMQQLQRKSQYAKPISISSIHDTYRLPHHLIDGHTQVGELSGEEIFFGAVLFSPEGVNQEHAKNFYDYLYSQGKIVAETEFPILITGFQYLDGMLLPYYNRHEIFSAPILKRASSQVNIQDELTSILYGHPSAGLFPIVSSQKQEGLKPIVLNLAENRTSLRVREYDLVQPKYMVLASSQHQASNH